MMDETALYKFCPLCGGGLEKRLIKAQEPARLVCTGCSFVFYIDPKLSVIAVVPLEGGVVMVRRSIEPGYGLWVVPGGFVDLGEKVEDAVVRETREETETAAPLSQPTSRNTSPGSWPRGTRPWRPGSSGSGRFPGPRLPFPPPERRWRNTLESSNQ
jgi:8-oxo-dGTP pyrophosphatase MutT (NUDIX family)